MVGNGQHLYCHHLCEAVSVSVQDITFVVDLHVFPLCGANLVLGVQWLKSLGPILTDYNVLCMKFFHDGRIVELKGDTNSTLHLLTPPQLRRLVRKEGAGAYFHISLTPTELPSTQITSTQLLPKIQVLITKFASLFQVPQSLPPYGPLTIIYTLSQTQNLSMLDPNVILISRNTRLKLRLIQCYKRGSSTLVPSISHPLYS